MGKESIFKNKKLLQIFKDETNEHINNITRDLMSLKDDPDNPAVQEEIAREAHTLKGSSKMMNFIDISAISHEMEDILVALREGEVGFSADLSEALYEGLEMIKTLMEYSLEGKESNLDIESMCKKIAAVKSQKGIQPERKDQSGDRKGGGEEGGEEEEEEQQKQKKKVPVEAAKTGRERPEKKTKKKKQSGASKKRETSAVVEAQAHISAETSVKPKAPFIPKVGDTIRVSISKLNKLVNMAGEIETSRIKFEEKEKIFYEMNKLLENKIELWSRLKGEIYNARKISNFSNEFDSDLYLFEEINQKIDFSIEDFSGYYGGDVAQMFIYLRELNELAMDLRLLPLSVVLDLFPYTVQQLAREYGKKIDLEISGASTRLDKKIIDGIKDPILHLVRNAISHGIETKEERVMLEKPDIGRIEINAYHEGDSVYLEVADDGRGIDKNQVKEKAIDLGLITESEAEKMNDSEIISFIFKAGFSTAAEVTQLSGRGVGMDVVEKNTSDLGGSVGIDSMLGKGTKITLRLPLTLTTASVLLVSLDEQIFAVPSSAVETAVMIPVSDLRVIKNKKAIVIDKEIIPVVTLKKVLQIKDEEEIYTQKISIVVINFSRQKIGFIVDKFIGDQEIVIKELDDYLRKFKFLSGATILPRGEVALMLHVPDLINAVKAGYQGVAINRSRKQGDQMKRARSSILVVDDAVTTRELEIQILESEGYEAFGAEDGLDALDKLRNRDCDLIVSDIQMPRMNGFDFVKKLRQQEEYRDIPVVFVTGLTDAEDRKKAIEAGATEYFVKTDFDQAKLLKIIKKHIER